MLFRSMADEQQATHDWREVAEALVRMVCQHCHYQDGEYDSGMLSANADAMRMLATHGRGTLTLDGHGRACRWKP